MNVENGKMFKITLSECLMIILPIIFLIESISFASYMVLALTIPGMFISLIMLFINIYKVCADVESEHNEKRHKNLKNASKQMILTVEFVISTLCHVFICACGGLPLNGIVITILFAIYAFMYFIWVNDKIQDKQFDGKKLALFFCLILILAIFGLVIGKLTFVHTCIIVSA